MTIESWSFDRTQLDDHGDMVKVSVLRALVQENLLTQEVADDWAAVHAVKLVEKTLWRTLSDRWVKAEKQTVMVTVKRV